MIDVLCCILFLFVLDPRTEAEGTGPWRQVQKARPEEGEGVCRRDDESSAGLQTQGLHGPQGQPQVCEEGGRQTGQGMKTPRLFICPCPSGQVAIHSVVLEKTCSISLRY